MQRRPAAGLYCCALIGAGLGISIAAGVPAVASNGRPAQEQAATGRAQVGVASWYGVRHQGRLTASGVPFDMRKLTAAHPTLPLNSKARVTNLENGKSVEVTINDRGPGVEGRLIDLSERAASSLGMKEEGLALVLIQPLGPATPTQSQEIALN